MIYLRKATAEDLPIIRTLAEQTWPAAYSHMLSAEQLTYMLEMMYNKGELLHQLTNGHIFLIASLLNEDVGFASFSLTGAETQTFHLDKLYVLPKVQGKGVGIMLMNEVISQVKAKAAQYLQLNVNRANKALGFYQNAGFVIKKTVDLDIGNGFFMNDYVMEKQL